MAAKARCFSNLRSILLNKATCLQSHNQIRLNSYNFIFSAKRKRRIEKGEAGNKTRYGPLTDLPDFTYLDGRPTPLSKGQKERKEERIQTAKRIMQLLNEMEMAQERYDNKVKREENELKQRQKEALKPKVHNLLE